jgi:uncharacterized membrane protein
MADLIAIGYPDETTAEAAADEARQLAQDLIIEPDAIAVIVRENQAITTCTPAITWSAGGRAGACSGDCCSGCCSSSRSSGRPSARGLAP